MFGANKAVNRVSWLRWWASFSAFMITKHTVLANILAQHKSCILCPFMVLKLISEKQCQGDYYLQHTKLYILAKFRKCLLCKCCLLCVGDRIHGFSSSFPIKSSLEKEKPSAVKCNMLGQYFSSSLIKKLVICLNQKSSGEFVSLPLNYVYEIIIAHSFALFLSHYCSV